MGVNFIYYRLSQPGNNTDVYATTDAPLSLDRIHCSDILHEYSFSYSKI